jgi:hypothetical protein
VASLITRRCRPNGARHRVDPIRSAKLSGVGYSDTTKLNVTTPTPDSTPDNSDGHLGDDANDKGPRLYREVNPSAVPNIYPGSKRGD